MAREIIENFVTDDNPFVARFTHYAHSRVCRASPNSLNVVTMPGTSDSTNAAISVYIRLWAYMQTCLKGIYRQHRRRPRETTTSGALFLNSGARLHLTCPQYRAKPFRASSRDSPFDVERTCNGKSRNEIPPWSARGKSTLFFRESSRARQTHVECTWT